ncbi:hypothetical protein COO91_01824 [Nostoc flagelliforme CCNUN1]|uniref:Uncharacterized protein n=1 Tax=Nostoc flagelliforme CCNUN1 TaxID=2038116 RepID=A0A2K8SKG3_9NOSO|nr:hypothetical protein COO91_01824 [Nostoc flagelliforme CCNUN1]
MFLLVQGSVTRSQVILIFYLIFVTLHSKIAKLVRMGSNSYELFWH